MTAQSAAIVDRLTLARTARIRLLLARARDEQGHDRLWSLAVACQLIDEHLAALACRATHCRRAEQAQAGWTRRRARVLATVQHERHLPGGAG